VDARHAGTGYLALPDAGEGRGVLVLHSWWGLTPFFKRVCDRLADAGFVALAPDLFEGETASTAEAAEGLLAAADPSALAHLVRSGLHHLRDLPITGAGPCGVVGFSMGASMALWLSAREADGVAATVVFYGTQEIDLGAASSAFLGHFAEHDEYVSEDDLVFFESSMHLDGLSPTFHRYPGTQQWFFEDDREQHDPKAAALAWERTLAFLDAAVPGISSDAG
jgi:carboxymethylenebutenolidase